MFNSPSKTSTTPFGSSFPTEKLAAVTRRRNEILDLLEDTITNIKEKVRRLYTEFLQKVEVFIDACNELLQTETVDHRKLVSRATWSNKRI